MTPYRQQRGKNELMFEIKAVIVYHQWQLYISISSQKMKKKKNATLFYFSPPPPPKSE